MEGSGPEAMGRKPLAPGLPTVGTAHPAQRQPQLFVDPLVLVAALDVARGLAYLHACNVVHGDLSLQNILITSAEPRFPEAALAAAEAAAVALEKGEEASGHVDGSPFAAISVGFGAVPAFGAAEAEAGDNMAPLPPSAVERVDEGDIGGSFVGASHSQSGLDGPCSHLPASPHVSAAACAAIFSSDPTDVDANTSTANYTGMLWGMYRARNTGGGGSISGMTPLETPGASYARGGGGGRGRLRLVQRTEALLPLLCQVFKISDFGLSVRLEGDETHRSNLYQLAVGPLLAPLLLGAERHEGDVRRMVGALSLDSTGSLPHGQTN
ncbi:hypothetical protein TSOC_007682 [Tetrabaena socialis]|uniref:Serine-threonine/tyrosine-protein kinase catalytic domain-containing protein n=1 Tax=Tetrabaena socialis TaxID=47790 RepID=A0A2J8A0G5_9CHLO|nr:hypothetical protein TSOC_007682 [Tetrabaena socialis]|eukprot:PNH06017.1 hypothetical protein TSOC_007682 [Tetrabaena socialis]